MIRQISRRGFVKSTLLVSASVPFGLRSAQASAPATSAPDGDPAVGTIGGRPFSRLMMGGNLIGGYAHARDLRYVATLMRRYNTPSKIRETLELGEANGITAINTWVMQENRQIFEHWKNGGKMQWFAQVRMDARGGFSQIQRAVDEGAVGIHLTGDAADSLLNQGRFEKVGESVEFIK